MKTTRILSSTHRLATAVALALAAQAGAATDTWVGNTSANWNALNWTGGNNPPLAADLLIFGAAGSAGAVLNNDLAALFALNGITFNAVSSAYTFGGSAITLAGPVTNSGTNAQTINFDMTLAAARTFTTSTGGGNLALGGIVSGVGGMVKAGVGTLTIAGTANSYTGETVFGLSGIVNVAALADYGVASSIGARTAAGDVAGSSIGLRFTGGTLQYTGATAQSTNREIRLANSATNAIDASGSDLAATLSFTHVGANKNLFENAGHRTLVLTGTNAGANSFAIRLTDQAPSANPATTAATGLTNLTKTGAGTWFITNTDSTYQGETTMTGGILNVASVSDYGVASSIGSRAAVGINTAGVFSGGDGTNSTGIGLIFRGGTLQYTGSTPQSTNRNIRLLNGNSGAIDASGANPNATFSFTHTGPNTNLFAVVGTRTLTLTGTNTGNNGFSVQLLNQAGNATSLTKTGTGNWLLNGPDANVNTGQTTVNSGTLSLGKTNAIAVNGALVIGDGVTAAAVRIDSTGTGGNQIADATVPTFNLDGALRLNNRAETIGGLSSFGGAGFVENESGAAGTGTLTVNVAGSQDFSGILRDGDGAGTDGALAFTKIGAGTQVLSGANAHTGATTVNGGTLTVDGSLAAGSAVVVGNTGTLNGAGTINGPVTIGNGGTVSGAGTFTSLVNVASGGILSGTGTFAGTVATVGGARISPESATTAGTLTFSALTLAAGALVDLEFGGVSDLIDVTGAGGLAINGGSFNLFASGGVSPLVSNGPYPLLAYETSYTGAIANLSIANAQPGKFYSLADDTANDLILLTIGDATVSIWNGAAANGLWTTGGALGNWSAGATPNAAGAVARFGAPGSPTAVAVDGAKTVGGIIFDDGNYAISGAAAITLNNGIAAAGITVAVGSHSIAAPIVLATNALASTATGTTLTLAGAISGAKSFTAAGTGTTILTGANSYTTTDITGGTLQIGNNTATGTLGSGAVSVASGGTLIFHRSDDLTVANNISGASGQVTKRGAGTLTLTGSNSFATAAGGGLNLEQGTVKLGSATAVPAGIILNVNGGVLDLNEFNVTTSALGGASGTITDNGGAGTSTLTIDLATDSNYGGSINNGAARAIAVAKTGPAILTLSGGNNFSQPLSITNGAVIAAGTGANIPSVPANVTLGNGSNDAYLIAGAAEQQFGAGTVVHFTNGAKNGKFLLRGTSQTVAGVDSTLNFTTSLSIIQNDENGGPGFIGTPGLATLTIDAATDHTFTGLIRNQVGGGLNLVKEGVGTQEIKNVLVQADNFGTLTINNGKFLINFTTNANNTNTLGASTTVVLGAAGTLGLDGGWTMNRAISGTGTVLKQGAGAVVLSGLNSHDGVTRIINGTLTAATAGGTALPANVTIGDGSAADIFLAMGAANQFGISSVVTFNNGTGNNAKLELRGFSQTIAGLRSDPDDTLSIVQNAEASAPVPATLTIDAAANHVFTGLIRTQSGGALDVIKNGAGAQEIRNVPAQAHNFGTLTINDGKFTVNLAGANNTLGAGTAVTVNAPGVLGLDGTWNMNRAIFGTGKVLKQGSGDVTISGAQSYAVLETTGGTTTLTTSLANATINNTTGTLHLNANATNSTVNVDAITNFGVSQTLAALDIGDGAIATLGAPGMAPAPEFDGAQGGEFAVVPEPGSIALLLSGLATALGRRRRRG